jgi:hypothetical protein
MHEETLVLNIFGIKSNIKRYWRYAFDTSIAYVSGAYLDTSYKNGSLLTLQT